MKFDWAIPKPSSNNSFIKKLELAVKMGFVFNLHGKNSHVQLYYIYGDRRGVGKMFDEILIGDLVSWTSTIFGYVRLGMSDESTVLILMNVTTFVSELVTCR